MSMNPPINSDPVVDSVDNAGTNTLMVPSPVSKSMLMPVLLSILSTVLIVGGVVAYTLNRYPEIYSNIGLLNIPKDKGESGDVNELNDEVKVDDKWVTYIQKKNKISFSVPSHYAVDFEDWESEEGNPYTYRVTVKVLVKDSKGNMPAQLFEIVEFTNNSQPHSYDDQPAAKMHNWAFDEVNVLGKKYIGKAYALGEGFSGYLSGQESVMFSIGSGRYINVMNPFSSYDGSCEDSDSSCDSRSYQFSISDSEYVNAKKIVESFKILE